LIIKVITLMRMKRVGHVAVTGEWETHKEFYLVNLKGRDHS